MFTVSHKQAVLIERHRRAGMLKSLRRAGFFAGARELRAQLGAYPWRIVWGK